MQFRNTLLAVTLLCTAASAPRALAQSGSAAAAMTNADVIALVGAGMSDDIVAAKIHAAPTTAFDTSVDGLTALKKANVSPTVIRVMIDPHAPAATPYAVGGVTSPAGNPDDPAAAHNPGLYTVSDGHMIKLDSVRPRGAKNSGLFVHAITHGIATAKTQQVIDGAKASLELTQSRPVFYAYIPDTSASFTGGMGIQDLVLTRFQVQGDTRLWTYAAHGLFGGTNEVGSDEKDRQGFTSEQVKPGIYKLTPAADLAPGQYAFKFAGSYLDFGIQPQS